MIWVLRVFAVVMCFYILHFLNNGRDIKETALKVGISSVLLVVVMFLIDFRVGC